MKVSELIEILSKLNVDDELGYSVTMKVFHTDTKEETDLLIEEQPAGVSE